MREGCQGFAEPNLSTLLYKSKNQPAVAGIGFEIRDKDILFPENLSNKGRINI